MNLLELFKKKRDKVIGIIIGILFLFVIAGCGVLTFVPDVAAYTPEATYVALASEK